MNKHLEWKVYFDPSFEWTPKKGNFNNEEECYKKKKVWTRYQEMQYAKYLLENKEEMKSTSRNKRIKKNFWLPLSQIIGKAVVNIAAKHKILIQRHQ